MNQLHELKQAKKNFAQSRELERKAKNSRICARNTLYKIINDVKRAIIEKGADVHRWSFDCRYLAFQGLRFNSKNCRVYGFRKEVRDIIQHRNVLSGEYSDLMARILDTNSRLIKNCTTDELMILFDVNYSQLKSMD